MLFTCISYCLGYVCQPPLPWLWPCKTCLLDLLHKHCSFCQVQKLQYLPAAKLHDQAQIWTSHKRNRDKKVRKWISTIQGTGRLKVLSSSQSAILCCLIPLQQIVLSCDLGICIALSSQCSRLVNVMLKMRGITMEPSFKSLDPSLHRWLPRSGKIRTKPHIVQGPLNILGSSQKVLFYRLSCQL